MTATAAPTSPACPRCGSAMPGDAPAGLCPRCLLSDGFGNVSEGDFRLRTGQGGPRFVPPTIDELAGEFPHLEFVQLLGSGGMGAVYLAKQIRLDRRVAVKILPPDLADDPAFAERFLREARALARLSHPNIVGVYDFGQTPGGLYYFLMEYIEGPTLRQVVANRTTEPKQALEIVRQVCDALQFAHDKGVVHRDIKPENILLDSQGRVKIADFGLAKLLGIAEPQPGSPAAGSLTHTRQAMGTPHYMAPEQITGSRGVDHRADIYSLGVVFYELLTGELPVGRFAPPSKKVQVDVRLDEVVLRSLEAEPNQRYQRASDVKTDVESISSTSPRNDDSPFPAATRFVREASAGTGRAVRRALAPTGPGQLSKYAIVALVWAATVPLALLCIALFETFERSVDVLEALFAMLGFLLALPAITAPIGTTLMGIAAVREVRRSNGSVTGLVPGLAAALLFPLLLIGPFLWWLIAVFLVFTVTGPSDEEVAIVVSLMLVAPFAAWLMTRITRAAWRKAADGLPPELIERELSIIPPAVRQAVQAIGDWVERMGLSSETLFGRAIPAEPVAAANEPAVAHYSVASTPATPRMSFKAIVGACWAVTLPLGALMFAFVENTPRGDPVYGIAVGLLGLFSVPAMTAPIATTLLGWSAVGDIRRSAGMIKGLPLAVFDGLCFPLLLLSSIMAIPVTALLVWIAYEAFSVFAHNYGPLQVIVLALIVLGIVGAIDAIIAFLVWRRVKASLSPVDEAQPAAPPPAEPESWLEPVTLRRHRDLVMAGIAITVALTLIGLQLLIENGFPRWRSHQPATVARDSAAPAVEVATSGGEMAAMPGAITEEDRERGWRMTPNGPEILPEWAANMLALYDQFPAGELDPNLAYTPEPINAALQNAHARYEEVLDNHTAATFEGDVVVFTIEPFPEELDRLTNEFWSRVDPLLNVDQQSILRYNFPLRYNQRHHLRSYRHNFVLPIGDGRWTIRIERSGQWYRWSARYPNAPPGTTDSPELPQYLRRFQYEFTRLTSLRKDGLAFDPQRLPLVAPKPAGTASTPSPFPANFADAGGMPPFGPLTGTDGMDMMGTDMYGSSSMAMSGDTGMMEMGMYGGNAPPGAVEMGMGFLPGNVDDDAALRNAFVQRGIDAGKAGEIVRIILSIEQDYRTVLEDHTQVSVEGATVHFSVRPFPEKLDELERRFWASVDPLLTVDQQRGLRKSLSVGKPWFATRDETASLPTPGFGAQSTRHVPAILAVGRGITHLAIERVGQWYRWNLDGGEEGQAGHALPQQETPSLPRWLRHFHDRYDELVPRSK